MQEVWKTVVGYEGRYQVSSFGRVKGPRRILRQQKQPSGHLRVRLYDGSSQKNPPLVSVHRLVLEAFVGPCPEGTEGCHNDGDPGNNRVENLRWATRQENQQDKSKHRSIHGAKNGRAKLTDAQVERIRNCPRRYGALTLLAGELGISAGHARKIRRGLHARIA